MKKIFVFIFGLLLVANIVGGALAWFFIFSPSAKNKEPVAIAVPDIISNKPPENNVRIQGTIHLPAELKKILDTKPDAILSVNGYINSRSPFAPNVLLNSTDIVKPVFPYKYDFPIQQDFVKAVADKESFFLRLSVNVCFDRKEKPCTWSHLPRFSGTMMEKVKFDGELQKQIIIKTFPTVVNRYQKQYDQAACDANNKSVSGVLTPTRAFLEKYPKQKKFLVLATPAAAKRPPLPYSRVDDPSRPASSTSVPLTKEEIAAAGDYGITYVAVTLDATGTAKFSVPIATKFQEAYLRMFAVACADNEDPATCVAKGFPLQPVYEMAKVTNHSSSFLVAKGFEVPKCGMKDQTFYLHAFKPDAPPADESVLQAAEIPEIYEGASF